MSKRTLPRWRSFKPRLLPVGSKKAPCRRSFLAATAYFVLLVCCGEQLQFSPEPRPWRGLCGVCLESKAFMCWPGFPGGLLKGNTLAWLHLQWPQNGPLFMWLLNMERKGRGAGGWTGSVCFTISGLNRPDPVPFIKTPKYKSSLQKSARFFCCSTQCTIQNPKSDSEIKLKI